jgi:hypothetical protein
MGSGVIVSRESVRGTDPFSRTYVLICCNDLRELATTSFGHH